LRAFKQRPTYIERQPIRPSPAVHEVIAEQGRKAVIPRTAKVKIIAAATNQLVVKLATSDMQLIERVRGD
jgi:hypothetical protein